MTRDVDYCPTCGINHNPWMTCATAGRLVAEHRSSCADCGHVHTDQVLGGICIGCACPWRPGTPARPRSIDTLPMFSDQDAE